MTDTQLPSLDTFEHIFGILCFAAAAGWVVKMWIGE